MKLQKRIWKIIKKYKAQEILGVILTICFTISIYLVPLASEYLIDEVLPAEALDKLIYGIVIFAVVCCLQPLVGYFKDKLFNQITESVTMDIRKKLFDNFLYSSFSFLDKLKSGELISVIMNDGRGASDYITNLFSVLLKDAVLLMLIVIGMLIISPAITVMVVVLFAILLLLNVLFSKKIQESSKTIQENYDEICTCISQANSSIVTIKSFGRENDIENKYLKIIKKMCKDNLRIDRITILMNNVSTGISYICLSIIYGFGALEVLHGNMKIGEVIALGLYFQMVEQPVNELMNTGISTNIIIPILDRIESYDKVEKEVLGEKKEISFSSIKINDLSFRYSDEYFPIFEHVTEQFPAKGIVNIIGESGAGKTTLIKLFLGMVRIPEKTIYFGQYDISKISLSTLRGCISYVPQELVLDNDSVINNIRYGNDSISDEEIENICRRLNIHDRINELPEKYNNIITERIDLSGGERQRILIARAVLQKKQILILDEPNSALDAESSKVINEIIKEYAKDKLVILVAHHDIEKLNASYVYKIEKGKMVRVND